MYLARPDIEFTINLFARYNGAPNKNKLVWYQDDPQVPTRYSRPWVVVTEEPRSKHGGICGC